MYACISFDKPTSIKNIIRDHLAGIPSSKRKHLFTKFLYFRLMRQLELRIFFLLHLETFYCSLNCIRCTSINTKISQVCVKHEMATFEICSTKVSN